jgi:hypothetical protein
VGNVLHGVPFRFDDLRRPVYDGVLLDFVLMPIVIAYTAWAFRRLRRAGLGSGRSAMTRARLLFVLPMVLGLPACAAFPGVAPTNLEPLLVGTKRADVEAVLGDPAERKPNGCGSIDTYRYNRGRRPEPAVMALGMVHPAAPLVVGLVAHPFLYYGQKADLDIVYDPNDTVIKYGPRDPADWDSLFASNHLWVDQTTAQDVAEHYHRIGVAETVNMETARTCLCHAARLGHPDPQVYLAETFGTEPGPAGGTPKMISSTLKETAYRSWAR